MCDFREGNWKYIGKNYKTLLNSVSFSPGFTQYFLDVRLRNGTIRVDSSKKKYFTSNFFIIRSFVGQTLFYLIYNRNIQKVRITKTAQHVSDPSLRQSLERINK